MRKFGKEKASPEKGRRIRAKHRDGEESWIKENWVTVSLLLIVILAVAIRTVFSYGLSAGSNFALSGSGAVDHQHTIERILTGTFGLSDPTQNYPYGGKVSPVLVDAILAAFAGVATLAGVSVSTAAAGTLAFSAPIAAGITCILIFYLGREMFDEQIGLASALFYAVLALPISVTVFSNGSTLGIVTMFFVLMTYFVVKAMKAIDRTSPGIKSVKDRQVLIYTVLSGVMLGVVALSWDGFGTIVVLMVAMMVIQAAFARFKRREFGAAFVSYSLMLLIGLGISVPFYVMSDTFFLAFTGPLATAAIAIACVGIFYVLRIKPKRIAFLVPAIVAVVALIAIYLAAPWLYSDIVNGNQLFESAVIASMMGSGNISVSYMAAFYGWATVWMPLVIFTYMLYRHGKKDYSEAGLMIPLWIIGMFVLSWLSFNNAVVAGAAYAIAAAACIVKLVRGVGMKEYFASIRGGGLKASVKKFLKPEPFISLVCVILLVAAPNIVLAADASTSSNDELEASDFFGGISYTVRTEDVNPMSMIWDSSLNEPKSGAVATWFTDSSAATGRGGFVSVTSSSGEGAVAVSNILLAEGSSGALAAMSVRLIIADGTDKYSSAITAAGLTDLPSFINDADKCKERIRKNPSSFMGVKSDVSDENAVYLASIDYITKKLGDAEISAFYNDVRGIRGDGGIAYVAINAGMVPLTYNDGSSFTMITNLNDYAVDDNGAASTFYTYGYFGVQYKEAMYQTFLWRGLFGIGSEAGASLPYDLAYGKADTVAQPGLGLGGFEIADWRVKYNPDEEASLNGDGWTYMKGYEALAKQRADGGLINYFSSVMLLKVSDSGSLTEKTGKITYGATNYKEAKVAVFEKDVNGDFVQRSTSFTDTNGNYRVNVPNAGTYEIRVYTGTDRIAGGTYVGNVESTGNLSIVPAVLEGKIVGATEAMEVTAVGHYSGAEKKVNSDASGNFTVNNLPSDVYTVYTGTASKKIAEAQITAYPGTNSGIELNADTGTVKASVYNGYGAPLVREITALSQDNGRTYKGTSASDGTVEIKVPARKDGISYTGKYSVFVGGELSSNVPVTVSKGSSVSAKVTVFDSVTALSGKVTVMAPGYYSVTDSATTVPSGGNAPFTVTDGNNYKVVKSGVDLVAVAAMDSEFTLAGAKNVSGVNMIGTITFHGANGSTFTFAVTDGSASGKLPSGEYVVQLVGNDGSCSVTKKTIAAGPNDMGGMNTEPGRNMTLSVVFHAGAGQQGVPFMEFNADVPTDSGDLRIRGMTLADGKAVVTVPDSKAIVFKGTALDDSAVEIPELTYNLVSGTDNASKTWYLGSTDSGKLDKQNIDTGVAGNAWLLSYESQASASYTTTDGKFNEVSPGKYYLVQESAGVYTYSQIQIFAGSAAILTIDGTKTDNLNKVTVTKSPGSTVKITPGLENKDVKHYSLKLDGGFYLMESGKKYLISETLDDKVSYANVVASVGGSVAMPAPANKVVLTGYVGTPGDGTAKITTPGTLEGLFVEVRDGIYEFGLPEGAGNITFDVSVETEIGNDTYSYTGTETVNITDEKKTFNLEVNGNGTLVHEDDDVVLTADTMVLTAEGFQFNINVAQPEAVKKTYVVKAVGPWKLSKPTTITVDGLTGTGTVNGTVDASKIGDGNTEMKVSISNLAGTAVATCQVPNGYVAPKADVNKVSVMVAGADDASPDAVNDREYMYAVTLKNEANYLMKVRLGVTNVPADWAWKVSDSEGRLLGDGSMEIPVSGYATTTVYVKVMKTDGDVTDIASSTISVTVTSTSGVPEVVGETSFTLEPKEANLDSSVSATGDNLYDTGSTVQSIFWVLLTLSIVAIVAIVWLGSKRGVFIRRR